MTTEEIEHVMALLEEGYSEQDIAEVMEYSLQWVHSSVILDAMNKTRIIIDKEQKTGLKNELNNKYMTRAQALLYHLKMRDKALDYGYYIDAIVYGEHVFNDMLILECVARPEV